MPRWIEVIRKGTYRVYNLELLGTLGVNPLAIDEVFVL